MNDHVLFWDIDGTLLTTQRAGIFALEEAAREVCGATPDFTELETSGLTDHQIAVVVVRECGGGESPETASKLLRAYERHLPERLGWRQGGPLPGVVDILDQLRNREDLTLLLLTGNTPVGAKAKLTHYGLDGYFAGGAFCVDGDDRPTIARRALEVAAEHAGTEISPEEAFVIGDTPHDITCGQAIGARTVAVATGSYSLEELSEHDPWLTLERLPDPTRFVELLGLDR
jgi:phosphoglycolate phosphatase-like HAD superfamily hydrolase